MRSVGCVLGFFFFGVYVFSRRGGLHLGREIPSCVLCLSSKKITVPKSRFCHVCIGIVSSLFSRCDMKKQPGFWAALKNLL